MTRQGGLVRDLRCVVGALSRIYFTEMPALLLSTVGAGAGTCVTSNWWAPRAGGLGERWSSRVPPSCRSESLARGTAVVWKHRVIEKAPSKAPLPTLSENANEAPRMSTSAKRSRPRTGSPRSPRRRSEMREVDQFGDHVRAETVVVCVVIPFARLLRVLDGLRDYRLDRAQSNHSGRHLQSRAPQWRLLFPKPHQPGIARGLDLLVRHGRPVFPPRPDCQPGKVHATLEGLRSNSAASIADGSTLMRETFFRRSSSASNVIRLGADR